MSTTPDLPPLRAREMNESVNEFARAYGQECAREAVRLDHASRVGANLLCAYGCASEAQDPANRKPCPWWCGDTSKCAASPLTELKRIHGEMVRCGYMDQDYCGKPWAGEHNEKMRKWQARFDELLAMLLASAPSTPPDEATSCEQFEVAYALIHGKRPVWLAEMACYYGVDERLAYALWQAARTQGDAA